MARETTTADDHGPGRTLKAPFIRAPEGARTVFLVILGAACGPTMAGIVLFGWRAAFLAAISIFSCVAIERLYYRVTRTPALLGRSHAYLTGVLLAMTLPPFVAWYVPVVAAAFAIIVGKAVFGGVGHFLWQPALVGRLAVAVIFAGPGAGRMTPRYWPVLAQDKLLVGDIMRAARVENYRQWRNRSAPPGADAFKLTPPADILASLTSTREPAFSGLCTPASVPRAKPAALMKLPPLSDLLYGARPGGIGETCAVVIIVAGLYLIYRNYVKWQLPLAFVGSAAAVVAVWPINLAGHDQATWWPLLAEGLGVGFTYVNHQLLSGELLLAALFLAPETTSRPVTTGGQVLFGTGCGVIAMVLRLYLDVPVPCYMAILAMNTVAPKIDKLWRPRVFGTKRFEFLRFAKT